MYSPGKLSTNNLVSSLGRMSSAGVVTSPMAEFGVCTRRDVCLNLAGSLRTLRRRHTRPRPLLVRFIARSRLRVVTTKQIAILWQVRAAIVLDFCT